MYLDGHVRAVGNVVRILIDSNVAHRYEFSPKASPTMAKAKAQVEI